MHKYSRSLSGMALAAALGVALVGGTAHFARASAPQDAPAKKDKNYKDTAEFDAYNAVIVASNPMDTKKLLAALDTWTQKYPTTDYKAERAYYYLQAYAGTIQPAKVLDTAKDLIAGGLPELKTSLAVPQFILNTLYLTSANVAVLTGPQAPANQNATQDELDTGAKGAQMLLEYGKEFFAADKKPAALPADQWAQGLKQVEDAAKGALFQIALYPGNSLLKKSSKDPATCAQAEPTYVKALQDYPDSGQVAQLLATVSLCQQAANPDKAQQAIYEYARAATAPTGGPYGLEPAGQKNIDDYLKRIYVAFHGSDEGLADLKTLAAKSPLPPAGFKVKSSKETSFEKEQEFKTKNPQLALWMNLKGNLSDTNGQQYFESSMKDADVHGENGAKALKGTLIGMELKGKPTTCRPDELLVAVPLPDAQGTPVAEIKLKLLAALTGAPATGVEIQWDGVPTAFTRDPFMLTMETEKAKIEGLTLTPCAAPAAKKSAAPAPATKGGAPPPKKK